MSKNVVYAIENKVNGKLYIGSTVNLPKRQREHLNSLRNNKHHSEHLQRAWNKYGEASFFIRVLEEVRDMDELRRKEKEWIIFAKSLNKDYGYNVSESTINFSASGKNHPMWGRKFSELGYVSYWKGKRIPEHIRVKMRKPRSEEGKSNMRGPRPSIAGEKNPMYGKIFTEEHKAKISESLKGKMIGDKNPMYGRQRTGDNAGNCKKVIQLALDGQFIKEYINITEAAKATGAIRQHISKCCKGERKQTGGYKWEYIN